MPQRCTGNGETKWTWAVNFMPWLPNSQGKRPWPWALMMEAANSSIISETIYKFVDILFTSRVCKISLFSLHNLKVHYNVHKSSLFVPRARKINPVCALLSYFCTIHSTFPKFLSPSDISTKTQYAFLFSPYMPHAPTISTPCNLIKIQIQVK